MAESRKRSLKQRLNSFYRDFDFKDRIKHDPIEIPHRYSRKEDIEVAGFVAACFAYGKVSLFRPVIESILRPGGKMPAEFFGNFSLRRDRKYLKGINYRFNKENDVLSIAYMLHRTLRTWGSLEKLFLSHYRDSDDDIKAALREFTSFFLDIDTAPVYGQDIKPYGLKQLLPSPEKGSACKRMNLFLRWMVRDSDIDLGVWREVSPSKLIIPLDTHIARIARCIGLTERNGADWKTAKEITETLRKFDRRDPVKYDFALCHHGISGLCRGKESPEICATCAFR